MSFQKWRQELIVGAFSGHDRFRGISTILSGTTVVSVSATWARSGAVIMTSPIQYTNARVAIVAGSDSGIGASRMITVPISVRAGAFEIVTAGSVAPTADLPVAWWIIR